MCGDVVSSDGRLVDNSAESGDVSVGPGRYELTE